MLVPPKISFLKNYNKHKIRKVFMDISSLFKNIKKTFVVQRVVELENLNLRFTIEPLTAVDELKVVEACKDLNDLSYIAGLKRNTLAFSIKKINDVELNEDLVEYKDDDGKLIRETKYIFLTRQIDSWPTALRDTLFEAFNDAVQELEELVSKKVKFNKFVIQKPAEIKTEEAGIPKGFRKIEEDNIPDKSMNEVDKLNQKVKDEAEAVEISMLNNSGKR